MPRRRNKLNSEPAEIEHYGVQNIDIRLASVASACADLSELERSPKDADGLHSKTPGKPQGICFGQDQIIALGGCKPVLPGEPNCSLGTRVGTLRAE